MSRLNFSTRRGNKHSAELSTLESQWSEAVNSFETTGKTEYLQVAGNCIYSALNSTYGEHFVTVALQAGGWPRPWEQSFSFRPPQGDVAEHDAILRDTLKDIGEAIKPWEAIPERDVITLIDLILICRNRKTSPFVPFGKPAGSGEWPHDNAL